MSCGTQKSITEITTYIVIQPTCLVHTSIENTLTYFRLTLTAYTGPAATSHKTQVKEWLRATWNGLAPGRMRLELAHASVVSPGIGSGGEVP